MELPDDVDELLDLAHRQPRNVDDAPLLAILVVLWVGAALAGRVRVGGDRIDRAEYDLYLRLKELGRDDELPIWLDRMRRQYDPEGGRR